MYFIYVNGLPVHNPFSGTDDETAISAKLVEEVNTHGSLDLDLNTRFATAGGMVTVHNERGLRWRGRVLDVEDGLDVTRLNVHCEGALAFLCDTIIPPFTFDGVPTTYGSSKGLFEWLIETHNAQLPVGDPRRFNIGVVDVHDPNNRILRSSESAMTTWEAIQTKLLDTSLGGYIFLSGDELDTINYVSDFIEYAGQTIHFGENLIDIIHSKNMDGVVTVLTPYGARVDDPQSPFYEQEPWPSGGGFHTWHDSRVHLATAQNPKGQVKYQPAIDIWGEIYGTEVFDDITLPANLKTASDEWLAKNFQEHLDSLEVTAADLSPLDPSIDEFKCYSYVRVICEPMDINMALPCMHKETDLLDESNTSITLGTAPLMLTNMIK